MWAVCRVYLFEHDGLEQAGTGAAQTSLGKRGYRGGPPGKYRYHGKPVYLAGVESSERARSLAPFQADLR